MISVGLIRVRTLNSSELLTKQQSNGKLWISIWSSYYFLLLIVYRKWVCFFGCVRFTSVRLFPLRSSVLRRAQFSKPSTWHRWLYEQSRCRRV